MQTHLVSSPSQPPAVEVRDTVRSLLASASDYVAARWRIASLEGREALRAGTGMVAMSIIVPVSLAVAYTGLMVALMWWVSAMWNVGAGVALAVLVFGHLMLAAACAGWLAHMVRTRRLFHATRKEFMEDKRWLEAHHPSKS